MYASNKRLTLLPPAEQAALYDVPEFDDDQRLEYFRFASEELVIVNNRPGLVDKVHCALQIAYFKAKHLFFKLVLEEVQEDVDCILQQYFQENTIKTIHVTDHEYYSQCDEIISFFKYQRWSKDKSELLKDQVKQISRRDMNLEFIIMEVVSFLRNQKIMRPSYTTMQTIISEALVEEREQLRIVIENHLNESTKLAINNLLVEDNALSDLAELKQDAKDFKLQILLSEIEKLDKIKNLYILSKEIIPKLKLSKQNINYYY